MDIKNDRCFKIFLIIVAIFISVFFLVFFGKKKLEEVSIRLKWFHNAQFAGIYVAQDKGFYKNEGIKVNDLEKKDNNLSLVDEVASGRSQFAIVSTFDFLKAANKGLPIVAVAAFYQYSPTEIISASAKKIYKPEDLVGKTVDEGSRFFIETVLAAANVPIDVVKFKKIDMDLPKALLSGEVDAVAMYRTGDKYKLEKENFTYNSILPERYGVDFYNDVLITSKNFYKDHPEIVKKFMEATVDGWEYAFKNKEEAISITLIRTSDKNKDHDKQMFILKESEPLMVPKNNFRIGFMTPVQWDYVYDLLHQHKLIGDFEMHNYFIPHYFFDDN